MIADYQNYQRAAEDIAIEAGALLRERFGHVSVREKGPADLVTDADYASQHLIAQKLRDSFPEHTLLAEEEDGSAVTDDSNPWRWIVDPLDGTMNFAHGFPFWCVSIALEHAGNLVVGVVHDPLTSQTYSASTGQGASRNGQPIRVSLSDRLETSLIVAAFPTNFGADADRQTSYFRRLSTGTHSLRRTGSSALNLALLAAGNCEVCYGTDLHPWDAAAGVVLVREAGGTITRFSGAPYDLYGKEILATNGRIHAPTVEAFHEAWPGR
ncbi:MAG: inositol monophosphatase family protein [Isosphaeraceae bacterium]